MSVTAAQVQAAVEARRERMEDFEERFGQLSDEEQALVEEVELAEQLQWNKKGTELPEVGTAYFVDYEHINEDLILIFKVGDQFFKMTGFYSSYDADEWEDTITEVTPREKTITVYEEI
jgi:hypothetical protein